MVNKYSALNTLFSLLTNVLYLYTYIYTFYILTYIVYHAYMHTYLGEARIKSYSRVFETFYIIVCCIFNTYLFPTMKLLLAFIGVFLLLALRSPFSCGKNGYPTWDITVHWKAYLKCR